MMRCVGCREVRCTNSAGRCRDCDNIDSASLLPVPYSAKEIVLLKQEESRKKGLKYIYNASGIGILLMLLQAPLYLSLFVPLVFIAQGFVIMRDSKKS